MALDNFWILPEGKEHPLFDPCLQIEYSPYSKDKTAFRGSTYSYFLENEFSITLFKKKVTPQEVKQIAEELKKFVKLHESKTTKWSLSLSNQEILDLSRMFNCYAQLDAGLAGWW
jgi:hypothetical protein